MINRIQSVSVVVIILSATQVASLQVAGAESYPATDPPLPKLNDPAQTEEPSVYRARRAELMKQMSEGVAVVFAEGREDGNGYRQSSDFYYLTGVQEEGAVLVLATKERTYREFLLLPNRDPEAERWTGERDPISAALRQKYGFQKIFRTARLMGLVLDLTERSQVLWQVMRPDGSAEAKPPDLEFYSKISAKLTGVTIRA